MEMRVWGVVAIIGAVISILGFIFHLQGLSKIGPESSFMYANPEWVSYGIQILILGAIVFVIGIVIKLRS